MKYVFYVTYADGSRDILECPDRDTATKAYEAYRREKRNRSLQDILEVSGYGTLEQKYYIPGKNDRIRTFN